MENRSGKLQFAAQLRRIAEIPIMGEGHSAFLMIDLDRLTVIAVISARRSVADMTDGHLSFRQAGQHILWKDFADQSQIFMGYKNPVVIHNNPAALLAPVL